jgi:hypothetical protein
MGADAEWQAAAGGAWTGIRLLLSVPTELVPGLGATSARANAIQATIRSADLAHAPSFPNPAGIIKNRAHRAS